MKMLETHAEVEVPRLVRFRRELSRRLWVLSEQIWYRLGKLRSRKTTFELIYRRNRWGSGESRSGPGSSIQQTTVLRDLLPAVLNDLKVTRLLDAPCGDFNWMKELDLQGVEYLGVDIVGDLIEANRRDHSKPDRDFFQLDLCQDQLPQVDLILCRDCLPHFSFSDAFRALRNFKQSGATFLLTTSYANSEVNADIITGGWRPLNLRLAPFCFPEPDRVFNEQSQGLDGTCGKTLALWRLDTLQL